MSSRSPDQIPKPLYHIRTEKSNINSKERTTNQWERIRNPVPSPNFAGTTISERLSFTKC